jgi:hypothetical protein
VALHKFWKKGTENMAQNNNNQSSGNEANHNLPFHDFKKNKRIVFRDKYDYNKAMSLKSPSLNKRYRFSVLPTVIFKKSHIIYSSLQAH